MGWYCKSKDGKKKKYFSFSFSFIFNPRKGWIKNLFIKPERLTIYFQLFVQVTLIHRLLENGPQVKHF